jgi:hypothetical protein
VRSVAHGSHITAVISLMISAGPLEIAHDRRWISRFSRHRRVLGGHNDDLADDQVAVQGSPGQIPSQGNESHPEQRP